MRVALFLLIVGVVTSADLGCAAPADGNGDSIKRIALSFDDAPKGAGPRFSGDERVARYAAAGHLIANQGRSVDIEALSGVYVDMLMGAVAFFHDMAIESLDQSPAHVILLHEND